MFAAADAEIGATFGLAYVLTAVAFGAVLLALVLYAAWATRDGRKGRVERWLDRRRDIRVGWARIAQPLERGDERVLGAVVEQEHAVRERVSR